MVLHLAAKVPPFDGCGEFFPDVSLLVNDRKVSDHHAILPTLELEKADLSELPVGERNLLLLVCRELLCAVAEPYVYEAVTANFTCGGQAFTAKGRYVLSLGWKDIDRIFRASLKEQPEARRNPPPCWISPRVNFLTRWRPLLPSTSPHRPRPTRRTPSWRRWRLPGKRRCRRTPSARGWAPRPPGRRSWRSWWAAGVCGAQRKKPYSHQGGDQSGHRPAGYFDLSHADGGVGTETDRHRQGRRRPRRFHGGDL